jgi:hypothetical protein
MLAVMVPAELKDFIVASTGASASFIGLLFVAMSFITDNGDKDKKRVATERILAESSYIALLNVFFVSLVALIPDTTIGYVTVIMAVLGLSNSIRLTHSGIKDGVNWGILSISTLLYTFEAIYGVYILFHHNQVIGKYTIMTIILFLFGAALGRAWELTGIRKS